MGSLHYAKALAARKERVTAMYSLETLGFYSSEPGSQHYPPPFGVMVMVPVYDASGMTVNAEEAVLTAPPLGPVSVKLSAGATGVTEFDAGEAALVPVPFVAVTVQV